MATGGDNVTICSDPSARTSSMTTDATVDTCKQKKTTKIKRLQPADCASAASGSGPSSSSSAGAKLDRIEAGIGQIVALLSGRQQQALSAGTVGFVDRSTSTEDEASIPEAATAAAADTNNKSPAADFWQRRAAELQDTITALVARLEAQAAQLIEQQADARRQSEAAAEERLVMKRRLASFRRQLDASQAARTRLSAALTSGSTEEASPAAAMAEAPLAGAAAASTARVASRQQLQCRQEMEETVVALTAQLDRSHEQLRELARSRDSLRERADRLQAALRLNGGGETKKAGLRHRSCSCDRRLHECCRRDKERDRGSGRDSASLRAAPTSASLPGSSVVGGGGEDQQQEQRLLKKKRDKKAELMKQESEGAERPAGSRRGSTKKPRELARAKEKEEVPAKQAQAPKPLT